MHQAAKLLRAKNEGNGQDILRITELGIFRSDRESGPSIGEGHRTHFTA
jgi:hypothetical protein